MPTPTAHLTLFGAPILTIDGQRVSLPRRKALALLAYLAVTGTPHTREALAALLWGDSTQQSAQAYLRNALWTLNKALGAGWASADTATVAVISGGSLSVDVAQFTALASAAQHSGEPFQRLHLLAEAAGLYSGLFLSGFNLPDCPEFDHWQTVTAQSLQRTAHTVYAAWVDGLSQTGDLTTALSAAQRWVALDSLHEPAHRALMRLYAQVGESAAAVRQYRELSRLLREELHAQPDPATTALYQQISAPAADRLPVSPVGMMPAPVVESSSDAHSNIRPLTGDTFILGRDPERSALLALLSDPLVRLVTVVGAGGMGKTRLSEQVGADAARAGLFPDGAHFISLAPLCNRDDIASTVACGLPFPMPAVANVEQALAQTLRDRRTLLVIDNCEHVLDGVPLFSRLLEVCPDLKILATSRERLNLSRERIYELGGLPIPTAPTAESPPVALFTLRAQQVAPGFAPTPDDTAHIARISRLVEGMPLGIELAAAWTPLLTPAQIADEIQRSLDFLAAPTRDVPERHQSLRAVFASSWEQTPSAQQQALARLSVFRGGFTLEAASAAAGADLPTLLGLVGKSLVKRAAGGRFEVHELLRQFADRQLDESTRQDAQRRHAHYIAAWLDGLLPALLDHRQPAAFEAVQADIDNVRAALRYIVSQRDAAALSQIVDPLGLVMALNPRWAEFADLFMTAAEALSPETNGLLIARLLIRAAQVKQAFTHQSVIHELRERAAVLLAPHTDSPQAAIAWVDLGALLRRSSFVDPRSEGFIRCGLALSERMGSAAGVAYATFQLGTTTHMLVRYREARDILLQAQAMYVSIGQPFGLIVTRDMLSENAFTLGMYEQAYDHLRDQIAPMLALGMHHRVQMIREEMVDFYNQNARLASDEALKTLLAAAQDTGDRRGAGWALYNAGWVKWHKGDYPAALQQLGEANHIFLTLGEDEGIIWTNVFMADTSRRMGRRAAFEQHVHFARERLEVTPFPWAESGLSYILGDAALADGSPSDALEHYHHAVRVSHSVHAILQTLRHLSGVAAVWAETGRRIEALGLALFILHNPSTWDDTLRRVRALVALLEAGLTEVERQEAQQMADALDLNAAVALALAQPAGSAG